MTAQQLLAFTLTHKSEAPPLRLVVECITEVFDLAEHTDLWFEVARSSQDADLVHLALAQRCDFTEALALSEACKRLNQKQVHIHSLAYRIPRSTGPDFDFTLDQRCFEFL